MPDERNEIYEGCTVVIQKGSYLKTCRVLLGRTYAFGKRGDGQFTLNLDVAVGCPFGSSFKMERMSKKLYKLNKIEEVDSSIEIVTEGGEDNRDLQDDGRSQKLSPEEIIQLKDSGLTGREVIQTITKNSTTFKDKTVFSQEKYVNKKQKKYDEVITIHKPSVRLLCNMYYTQDPLKIANLRIDALSQLLCHCNVQPGGCFGVFESGTQGLVTAAMLHRMGTTGHLVQVYHGHHPQREAIDLMNFTVAELEVLSFINFTKLADNTVSEESATNGTKLMEVDSTEQEETKTDDVKKNSETAEVNSESTDPVMEQEKTTETKSESPNPVVIQKAGDENVKDNKQQPTRPRKFVRKQTEDVQLSSSVLRGSIDGLVVACRQDPSNVTLRLLKYLRPGHPFVVFSPYKELLMRLYMEVKIQGGTNLRVSETWLRHYQVLPQRTHPEINMSGGGGYLLCGTRIIKE